jgi:hypothetical protein
MADLVDQLRKVDHGSVEDCFLQSPLFAKAANEIERLRAENVMLRREAAEIASLVRQLHSLSKPMEPTPELAQGGGDHLPEWMRWQGDGEPPPCWEATSPETGERAKVYRSYADYSGVVRNAALENK